MWQPNSPGLNALRCGDRFMKSPNEERFVVDVENEFKVLFTIEEARGGGTVTLRMKYGPDPDFYYGVGFELVSPTAIGATDDASQVTLSAFISEEIGYNMTATIEVAYFSNDGDILIQCIDIDARSDRVMDFYIPPHGYGDPTYDPEEVYDATTYAAQIEETGLSTFHIVLLILIIILVFCFFVLWMKYKERYKVESEHEEPIMAEREEIQAPPVKPESEKREPTPSTSAANLEPPQSEQEVEVEVEKSHEEEREDTDPNDGSSGRHFHFRYVDDDDDKS